MLTKSKETTGNELDLLANYPKANRNLKERLENKTDSDRKIARRFGKQFFDGDRRYGYGGLITPQILAAGRSNICRLLENWAWL